MNEVEIEKPTRHLAFETPVREVVVEMIHIAEDQTFYADDQPDVAWKERT